jgi:hypothetical protein
MSVTEERAIEYLIMKDLPQHVWKDYDKANKLEWLFVLNNSFLALEYGEMLGRLTKN